MNSLLCVLSPGGLSHDGVLVQAHWMQTARSGTMWCSCLSAARTQKDTPATATSVTSLLG